MLRKIAEGSAAGGHEIHIITSSWQRHSSGIEKRGSLTVTRIFTFPVFKRFWFMIFSLPSVIRAAWWADIIQGSTFAGAPPAFLAAVLARKKKILIVYEVFGRKWFKFELNLIRSLFYYLTERIIIRLPYDHFIAISEYTEKSLVSIGVSEKKITVIYPGDSRLENPSMTNREVRKQLNFKNEEYIYLASGRTGITKGFEFFAEAIPKILKLIPEARFILILSMYDKRIWKRVMKSISFCSEGICRVIKPVSREMLAAYVNTADCVVIPSVSEGFGFCAREAVNAGKTIVAANSGSLPEVITGRHVFVEPGSASALAAGCVNAFKGDVKDLPAKDFSWDRTVRQYLELYKEILAS
ncbi:MAG: glycosyltransferase family 4 protein [Bacteroidetes bacterium]|nr:glycosyltransferase family 4 protein [Bacteroidota bacterium]